MATKSNNHANFYGELRAEFLDEARDKLDNMAARFRAAESETEDAYSAFQSFLRSLHSLKGQGSTFGFPSLTLISHLFEDRMHRVPPDDFGGCGEVMVFLDRMAAIVESETEPDEATLRGIMERLAALTPVPQQNPATLQTVVIVSGSATIAQLVRFGLEERGFRAVFLSDPYEALAFIVTGKPAAVVCTSELRGLSGFDLVHSLVAMPATAGIRVALLTSHGTDHPGVRALPGAAAYVQVGPEMIDRLCAAFGGPEAAAV